jgi:hypothetical protein
MSELAQETIGWGSTRIIARQSRCGKYWVSDLGDGLANDARYEVWTKEEWDKRANATELTWDRITVNGKQLS